MFAFLRSLPELAQRAILGSIVIACLTMIFYSMHIPYFNWFFALCAFGLSSCAMKEFFNFVSLKGIVEGSKPTFFCYALYFLSTIAFPQSKNLHEIALFGSLCTLFSYYAVRAPEQTLSGIASAMFALIYIGLPFIFLYKIAYQLSPIGIEHGKWCVIYIIAVTKAVDLGGYAIGKTLGKRRLCPSISPKKTWEGTIGGVLGAIIMSCSLFPYIQKPTLEFINMSAVLWGLVLGIFAQLGDLVESLLKRDVGVKDSSCIPGLGGILDMTDSLLLTIPIFYCFWTF